MRRAGEKIIQLCRGAKKRRDDRGSAIVIVIIAMAMIGILATTLLWMAYMNYMIKVADIRNKNSFYSAEEVVEQIMSGLRRESAEAVGIAYRDVLANWDNLDEAARSNVFMTTYMDTLIDKLKDPSHADYYDKSKLAGYVDGYVDDTVGFTTPNVDFDDWKWGGNHLDPTVPRAEPKMEIVNNNSIILKNIYVYCTDAEERVSIVKTDICLDVPKLIFENPGSIDSLYQYTLIGNEGIEIQGLSNVKAEGSIYAGTDVDGNGGLSLGITTEDGTRKKVGNAKLVMDDALRVISKGDISVVGPASGLTVRDMPGQDNRVYARNITLDSAAASLDSKVYVANDLTLDGIGSKVTLTKEYYGYGNSTFNGLPGEADPDSGASSAIIINGRDSTVDMSALTRLLIAGRSYIGQDLTSTDAAYNKAQIEAGLLEPRTPVMMGESIAIKGGQVAYLVPAECIGTLDGESVIGQNPISDEKENDIKDFKDAYGDAFKVVDFDRPVYRLGGKTLRQMGVGGSTAEDDMKYIRNVWAPYQGHSLVYYYLVMDKDTAEKYFVQYYNFNANKEEIDTYFDRYLSGGFQLGDFEDPKTQYTILGNSLVSSALSESGVTLLTSFDQTTLNPPTLPEEGEGEDEETETPPADPDDYTETGINAEKVTNDQIMGKKADDIIAQIKKDYKGLTYNLKDEASLPPEIDPDNSLYNKTKASEYVFKSIIKCKETGGSTDNVEDYLADLGQNHVTYTTSSGLKAYLTKSDNVTVSSIGSSSEVRLVVSLGNVTVDQDFTGLIIAKGKITVTGDHTIKLGGTDLANVLEAKSEKWVDDGTPQGGGDLKKPIDMFVNGGGSLLNGAEAPNVDDEGNLALDYSELVRYMNWIKR